MNSADQVQIGDVAEWVGLSLRTIRYYEEIGLAVPSGRTEGGFRLYRAPDIERLRLVKALKPLGMPLEELSELLGLCEQTESSDEDRRRRSELLTHAIDRADRIGRQLAAARETIERLSETDAADRR